MNQVTLSMIRGSTFSFDVAISNSGTGLPENLTNGTLKFTAKWDLIDSDASAVFQKSIGSGITITNASQGQVNIVISPTDTSTLPFNTVNLNYDLKYTDSIGNIFTTLLGLINITSNVTQT